MQNLNALLLPGRALCVSQAGVPCTPLRPYLIGDTVFADNNGNGVQDPGEPGIGGVDMELSDAERGPARHHPSRMPTATTRSRSRPTPTPSAIAASNYTGEGGGARRLPRRPPPRSAQRPIINDNVLTCDFGYRRPGSHRRPGVERLQRQRRPGCRRAGHQRRHRRACSTRTANLVDDRRPRTTTATTPSSTCRRGTYTVRVDDPTCRAALTPTYDLDGVATPHEAAVTVAGGQTRTDVDFGYQGNGSIGDRVWNDANANGVQDPGEAGINGVTVQLLDDAGNLIATTVTAGDGNYTFTTCRRAPTPSRSTPRRCRRVLAQTYDLDGVGTPNAATFILVGGRPDRRRLRLRSGHGLDRRPRLERRQWRRRSGCRRARPQRRDRRSCSTPATTSWPPPRPAATATTPSPTWRPAPTPSGSSPRRCRRAWLRPTTSTASRRRTSPRSP